jgi:hypothetical protein
MRVAEAELRKLNLNPEEMFVAQGTLRPGNIRVITIVTNRSHRERFTSCQLQCSCYQNSPQRHGVSPRTPSQRPSNRAA